MSGQTLKVLGALMGTPGGELSGTEIGKQAGLQSGTLYPILARLEACGWLDSRWEDGDPKEMGRPRRRYYQLTGVGQTRARAEGRKLSELVGRLAWVPA